MYIKEVVRLHALYEKFGGEEAKAILREEK